MNNKSKDKKKINDKIKFIIMIVLVSIIRFVLTSQSSIYVFGSKYDDLLVIKRAKSIIKGNWLGSYNHLTLVKGIGFEIFLVIFNFLKISFVNAQSIMYILACIYFIYAIRNLIKSKKFLLVIYVLMLFNPISLGFETFQRVYRYSIIHFQVLFVFSSYYLLYENINEKKGILWPHILLASIFLTWFRLTIESYIWIIPFVLVVTGMLIFNIIKNKKQIILKILIVIIPIFVMFVTVYGIKIINQNKYGNFVYNEILETSFSDALKAIYSVDIHDDIQYVSVSQNKLEKLYEISPSLNSIKSVLNKRLVHWKKYDQVRNDEIEDGWFYWALRESVEFAGYNTAEEANNFYKNIANEIDLAIEEGKVDSKVVMSNPLMSPFRNGYVSELLITMFKSFMYVISFDGIDVLTINNEVTFNGFTMLEKCISNKNLITTAILGTIIITYQMVGIIAFIISFVIYCAICKKYCFDHKSSCKNIWLISTACILTSILLITGVSYTHISAFNSINSVYLVGCYPLIGIFILLNIIFYIENDKEFFNVGEINE